MTKKTKTTATTSEASEVTTTVLSANAPTKDINTSIRAVLHADGTSLIGFNGKEYKVGAEMTKAMFVHGVISKAGDAVVRNGDKLGGREEILERLTRGFWNKRDEEKVNKATSATGGMSVTRAELMEVFDTYDGVDKDVEEGIAKLSELDDEKFELVVESHAYKWVDDAVGVALNTRKERAEQAKEDARQKAIDLMK